LEALWAFLSDPDNQQTLAWLGGGLVAVAGGLWAVIKFFFPRSSGGKPTSQTISADRGGIAASGNVSIGSRHGLSGIEVALLVAIVIGGLLLAAALAGTRITVENGVGVGGDVENSTISIERDGSAEP
jgi:hypothetical protein